MKDALIRLNRPMTLRGIKMPAGRETVMEARMAGALAADGIVTLLESDNDVATRARDVVVEARRAVHGPKWNPGAARGVECRAYGTDGRLMHQRR